MRLALPWIALLAGCALAGAADALPAADAPPLAGAWVGELVAGATRARIVLRIEEKGGGLAGHVDSPDEGLENLPAEGLRIDGGRVSFELRLAGARFEGQVAADGSRFFSSPWYRTELAIDPPPVIRSLRVPVLALGGSKDHLNPSEQSLPAIQAALEEGGNPDYTVAKLPGLNHVFQTAETGGMAEWGRLPETFAPLALATISDWILARFGSGKG